MVVRILVLGLSIFCTFSTALAQDNPTVEHAWARESPPGSPNGVVYFMIKGSDAADRLTGIAVSSEIANRAELHTHRQEGGTMKMEKLEAINIPGGGQTMLKPHGDHVMLIGLKQPLKQGETISLELMFENAGTIGVDVPVLIEAPAAYSH